MHLVLDTVLCCHPLYCFAAATSSVWVFQINDQQVKWTPPIQNVYRSVTDGLAADTGVWGKTVSGACMIPSRRWESE